MADDDRSITPEMIANCTTDRLILMRDLILLPLTIHSRYLDVIPTIDQELRRRGLFPQDEVRTWRAAAEHPDVPQAWIDQLPRVP